MNRIALSIFVTVISATAILAEENGSGLAGGRYEKRDLVPAGRLGFPIGTYVTIHGVRSELAKDGGQTLVLHTINGNPLTRKRTIWVENLKLQPNERYTIKGYESAKWVGIPPEVIEAGAVSVSPGSHPPWHLFRYFIATSVDLPQGTILEPVSSESFAAPQSNPQTADEALRQALATLNTLAKTHPILDGVPNSKPLIRKDERDLVEATFRFAKNATPYGKALAPGPVDEAKPFCFISVRVWRPTDFPGQPAANQRTYNRGNAEYQMIVTVFATDETLKTKVSSVFEEAMNNWANEQKDK